MHFTHVLRFLSFSTLGILFFGIPFPYQGEKMILIALLAKIILSYTLTSLPFFIAGSFLLSTVLSLCLKITPPAYTKRFPKILSQTLPSSWVWIAIHALAALWSIGVLTAQLPSSFLEAGKTVLFDILPSIAVHLLIANLLLPLLLDGGLFEYIGVLLEPIMRPLFNLPGYAAVNCLLAWVGDSSVGSFTALAQYEKKKYTPRETAIVITCFSATSITLCMAMLASLQLKAYFWSFYLTTVSSSLVAAMILSRIPPLSWLPHTPPTTPHPQRGVADALKTPFGSVADTLKTPFGSAVGTLKAPFGSAVGTLKAPFGGAEGTLKSPFGAALEAALLKASHASWFSFFHYQRIAKSILMLLTILPSIMVVGSLSFWIATHTPIFALLGKPFAPLLAWLGVPEAQAVSQTLFVGFLDMLIPSLLIKSASAPMARFIVVCLSVSQIVYLSEIGALLFGSRLAIRFRDLLLIFLLRTLITLPIIILVARYLFLR